jgi:lipoate-protein ligase A
MPEIWRLLDTGLAAPASHIALNRALLEARDADEIASTLRFARSTECALLGVRQSAGQVLDLDYCRARKIPIQRRISGGPAGYVDERQLIFELYLHRRDVGDGDLRSISRTLCHAAATGISALGIDARYRARNDIEVDGRLLATSSCALEGGAILFQATLFIELDPIQALSVFRAPGQKFVATEGARRIVSVRQLIQERPDVQLIKQHIAEAFESEFDVEFREAEMALSETARYQSALRQIESQDWIDFFGQPARDMPLLENDGEPGGTALRALVLYEMPTRTIREAWFLGDIAMTPDRTVLDLEAALRDTSVADLERRVHGFFHGCTVQMAGLTPSDFLSAVQRALKAPLPAGN